ncbi:MAG TPA: hypothetical protein VLJ59_04480 [Mycobacteriales bacterium]|nr:hypothetical protein [Mycobacteriales bacterium]
MSILTSAVLGLTVGACGQGNGTQAGGNAPPPASSVPPSPPAPTSTAPAPSRPTPTTPARPAPTKPGPAGRALVIQGVIERGVEPGCYLLTSDQPGPKYLVLSPTPPPIGVPVTVHGTTSAELSYCQQGTPLRVSSIQRR